MKIGTKFAMHRNHRFYDLMLLMLTAAPRLVVIVIYIMGVEESRRHLGTVPEVNGREVSGVRRTVEKVGHVMRGLRASRAVVQGGRVDPGFVAVQAGGEA